MYRWFLCSKSHKNHGRKHNSRRNHDRRKTTTSTKSFKDIVVEVPSSPLHLHRTDDSCQNVADNGNNNNNNNKYDKDGDDINQKQNDDDDCNDSVNVSFIATSQNNHGDDRAKYNVNNVDDWLVDLGDLPLNSKDVANDEGNDKSSSSSSSAAPFQSSLCIGRIISKTKHSKSYDEESMTSSTVLMMTPDVSENSGSMSQLTPTFDPSHSNNSHKIFEVARGGIDIDNSSTSNNKKEYYDTDDDDNRSIFVMRPTTPIVQHYTCDDAFLFVGGPNHNRVVVPSTTNITNDSSFYTDNSSTKLEGGADNGSSEESFYTACTNDRKQQRQQSDEEEEAMSFHYYNDYDNENCNDDDDYLVDLSNLIPIQEQSNYPKYIHDEIQKLKRNLAALVDGREHVPEGENNNEAVIVVAAVETKIDPAAPSVEGIDIHDEVTHCNDDVCKMDEIGSHNDDDDTDDETVTSRLYPNLNSIMLMTNNDDEVASIAAAVVVFDASGGRNRYEQQNNRNNDDSTDDCHKSISNGLYPSRVQLDDVMPIIEVDRIFDDNNNNSETATSYAGSRYEGEYGPAEEELVLRQQRQHQQEADRRNGFVSNNMILSSSSSRSNTHTPSTLGSFASTLTTTNGDEATIPLISGVTPSSGIGNATTNRGQRDASLIYSSNMDFDGNENHNNNRHPNSVNDVGPPSVVRDGTEAVLAPETATTAPTPTVAASEYTIGRINENRRHMQQSEHLFDSNNASAYTTNHRPQHPLMPTSYHGTNQPSSESMNADHFWNGDGGPSSGRHDGGDTQTHYDHLQRQRYHQQNRHHPQQPQDYNYHTPSRSQHAVSIPGTATAVYHPYYSGVDTRIGGYGPSTEETGLSPYYYVEHSQVYPMAVPAVFPVPHVNDPSNGYSYDNYGPIRNATGYVADEGHQQRLTHYHRQPLFMHHPHLPPHHPQQYSPAMSYYHHQPIQPMSSSSQPLGRRTYHDRSHDTFGIQYREQQPPPIPSRSSSISTGKIPIEVSPGVFERLRGAQETLDAIEIGAIAFPTCIVCSADLVSIADADYVLCPVCLSVSPILADYGDDNNDTPLETTSRERGSIGGVGLGVRANQIAT